MLEGNHGIVRCQNRSNDEKVFYSYISNALWYRDYGNGTQRKIGNSGAVYSSRHSLIFKPPLRKADEGVYYCCLPDNVQCGNNNASNTVVKISSKNTFS